MSTIKLCRGLTLPNDQDQAASDRYALVGLPGSGKSNAAAVLVEGLLDAGEQVIVLDPAAIWWSLRLKRNGKIDAYPVAVLGGDHGDVPLTPDGGKLVAEALATSSTSAVVDLSDFTIGQQRRFVAAFAEAFFHAKKKHRSPVMVVLEEAHEFIPQHVTGADAPMFGALKRAAKIGRNYGIGWCYLDHRPQELHKAILNLVRNLFVFTMSGAHERKAIKDWLVESESGGHARLDADLTKLPVGKAQVWAPRHGIDGQYQFPLKKTYDAGKTPVRGDSAVKVKPMHLGKLREALAELEADAEANDPKVLKRRIVQLERELKNRPAEQRERLVYPMVREDFRDLDEHVNALEGDLVMLKDVLRATRERFPTRAEAKDTTAPKRGRPIKVTVPPEARTTDRPPSAPRVYPENSAGMNGNWPSEFVGKMKDIVVALKRFGRPMNKAQLGILVGMRASGGGFNNYLGKLRGLSVITPGAQIELTPYGKALASHVKGTIDGDAVVELWRPRLPSKAIAMVQFLRSSGSGTKADLAEYVDMNPTGGGFNNYLGMLRTAGLIRTVDGEIEVTELLQ